MVWTRNPALVYGLIQVPIYSVRLKFQAIRAFGFRNSRQSRIFRFLFFFSPPLRRIPTYPLRLRGADELERHTRRRVHETHTRAPSPRDRSAYAAMVVSTRASALPVTTDRYRRHYAFSIVGPEDGVAEVVAMVTAVMAAGRPVGR